MSSAFAFTTATLDWSHLETRQHTRNFSFWHAGVRVLMLEQYERAASAVLGATSKHGDHSRAARNEETLFCSVRGRLGWRLPRGKS